MLGEALALWQGSPFENLKGWDVAGREASRLGGHQGEELAAVEEAILRQDESLPARRDLPRGNAPSPYRGLLPYDVHDAESFFGREAELSAGLDPLRTRSMLAVVGA